MYSRLSVLLAAVTLMACPAPHPQPPPPAPPDAGPVQQPPDAGPVQQPPDAGPMNPPDAGPPPLIHLEGPLELQSNVTLPQNLRVGVLWFAGIDPQLPSGPRASESGNALSQPLPSRWQLDVRAEPPAEARSQFQSPGGGAGTYAVGTLVIYNDADGDGTLTIDQDGSTSDQIVGSSAGAMPFDLESDPLRTLIIWREGTIGTDETGFTQGFNLVTINEPFAQPTRVPLDTNVTLRPNLDPRLNLMFCPPAFVAETPEIACGQRVYRAPRIAAMLMAMDQFGFVASVGVKAGQRDVTNARVLLNGVVLPVDPDGNYGLLEFIPSVIHTGVNQVRVEVADMDSVEFEVTLPAVPTLSTPFSGAQLPTAQSVTIAWQPVPGATSFDVSLFPDSGQGGAYETTTQTHLDVMTPADPGAATLSIGVIAEGRVGRHLSLGTSNLTVPVELVTP